MTEWSGLEKGKSYNVRTIQMVIKCDFQKESLIFTEKAKRRRSVKIITKWGYILSLLPHVDVNDAALGSDQLVNMPVKERSPSQCLLTFRKKPKNVISCGAAGHSILTSRAVNKPEPPAVAFSMTDFSDPPLTAVLFFGLNIKHNWV